MNLKSLLESVLTLFGFGLRNQKNANKKERQIDNDNKIEIDITKGFQIDNPKIFIPWDIDENTLTDLFKDNQLKRVTNGYYTTSCTSLGDLTCLIGFHFQPQSKGILNELEFFRSNYDNQQNSFDEFQTSFVKAFGQPTYTKKGDEGFNNYVWQFGKIQIVHYVFDRFGPEEYMRIKKHI
jgi:hypothetical protein